jgi:hypothetical protein
MAQAVILMMASRMLNFGIWNRIDAYIAFAMPTQCPHD